MFEVEVKVRIDDPKPIRDRLRRHGLTGTATTEVDTYFAHPFRDLAGSDEALRIRAVEQAGSTTFRLTYKGPRRLADAKVRVEHEVVLDDDATPILVAIGLRPAVRLTKTRETYQAPEATLTIDHLDGLGWFVEVESRLAGIDAGPIMLWLARLGLEKAPHERRPYLELARAAGASAFTPLD